MFTVQCVLVMFAWDAQTLEKSFRRPVRAQNRRSLRSRLNGAAAQVGVVNAKNTAILASGGENARRFVGRLSTDALAELQTWAAFRHPNYWYILFNGIQIVTCLAVLVIGFVCVEEARDDLNANVASKLTGGTTVSPCGMPAPDMLHLLRLQGVYENQLGLPQFIEPDYKRWNVRVQGSMCSSDVYWQTVGNDGLGDTAESSKARLLHGLANIMSRRDLTPADDSDASALNTLEAEMLNDLCNTESNRTYSKRLETAFGDPLTRIARAYLAAAPAFRTYVKSKDDPAFSGGTCLGDLDPFGYTELRPASPPQPASPPPPQTPTPTPTKPSPPPLPPSTTYGNSMCSNADYINLVLQRAGSLENSARLAGIDYKNDGDKPTGPLEMLYALYALSVINHYDKTKNDGACFKNSHAASAVNFCTELYGSEDFTGYENFLLQPNNVRLTVYGKPILDVNYYRASDEQLWTSYRCSSETVDGITLTAGDPDTVSPSPAPPPFISFRGDHSQYATKNTGKVKDHVIASCAATLQYGLYDQERLFGVPDVLHFFQHDNRPDASLHFLGDVTAQSYFLGPLDEAATFDRPVKRLELYLAYRLASLTLWGALVASVTGFFIGRSGVPLGMAALSLIFGLKKADGESATVAQPASRSIFQDTFTILAALLALATAYYTIFVDPSAQSYYPTTPKCNDYILGSKYVHSAGGAYVTSWGKRRFNRYSETQIGIVLVFVALVPAIYTFTKAWVQSGSTTRQENRIGVTLFNTSVNVVYLVGAGTIVGSQVWNCINTGNHWMDASRVSPYDTTALNDMLGRDCVAMVLISYWAGLAVSVNRASWVLNSTYGALARLIFFGGCVFTIWLGQISYLALLGDEYADAFSYPSKDNGRRNAQIVALVGYGLFTGAVVVEAWSLQKERGRADNAAVTQGVLLREAKVNVDAAVEAVEASAPLDPAFLQPATRVSTGPYDAGSNFSKLATVHVDPRALTGTAPAQMQTRAAATTAVGVFARLPLPSGQRGAPMGTRGRGQYAPMPPLSLRH